MTKRVVLPLTLAAILLAVLALYYFVLPLRVATPTKAPGEPVSALMDPYVERTATYDISAAYPTSTALMDGGAAARQCRNSSLARSPSSRVQSLPQTRNHSS